MNTKHRWYDVIVAWANGEKIQVRNTGTSVWENVRTDTNEFTPHFDFDEYEWRVKPKTITKKYRMALVKCSSGYDVDCYDITSSSIDDPAEYDIEGFIRWVGDAAEVEIEV